MNSVTIDGRSFFCGCLPRVAGPGELFPLLADKIQLLPREQWQPCDWRRYVREIRDQDGQGACNSFSSTTTLRGCRVMAGLADVRLSAGHLYGRINGGRDRGSLLGDALKVLLEEGCCTVDQIGELDWQRNKWPPGVEQIARKYKGHEAFDCPSFQAIGTALQCGFLVNYGILVGSDFKTDDEGWVYEAGGRGGHAMCGVGLARRERRGRTQWGVITVNSWGERWGQNGIGIVPESYFSDTIFTDGWALRTAVDPSDETWKELM